jgi:hypothetical protein
MKLQNDFINKLKILKGTLTVVELNSDRKEILKNGAQSLYSIK